MKSVNEGVNQMIQQSATKFVNQQSATEFIDASIVKRAYVGINGCACGCRGDYAESFDTRKINTRVNKINRLIAEGEKVFKDIWSDETIVWYVSDNDRVVTLYLDIQTCI